MLFRPLSLPVACRVVVIESALKYRVCARRPYWRTKTIEDICIKIENISQRKIIVLFRSSSMAVVHTLYRRPEFESSVAGELTIFSHGSKMAAI